MTQLSLIERALRLAARAHEGQVRKGDPELFITHPVALALKLTRYGFDDTVVAAALLHDVVEDTDITNDQIRADFGNEVADIVAAVTHEGDDKATWKKARIKYIEQVINGPEGAKAVSAADKIHNNESLLAGIESQGTDFLKDFGWDWEKKLWFERTLLTRLQGSWQHPILDELAACVADLERVAKRLNG